MCRSEASSPRAAREQQQQQQQRHLLKPSMLCWVWERDDLNYDPIGAATGECEMVSSL